MAETKRMVYNIPLRSSFTAQVVLPHDLTVAEAARLRDMLLTIPIPNPRGPVG